jgi:hypothetical protein
MDAAPGTVKWVYTGLLVMILQEPFASQNNSSLSFSISLIELHCRSEFYLYRTFHLAATKAN